MAPYCCTIIFPTLSMLSFLSFFSSISYLLAPRSLELGINHFETAQVGSAQVKLRLLPSFCVVRPVFPHELLVVSDESWSADVSWVAGL